jgi:hypothetical protein
MSDHAMLEMTWSLAFPARFITIRTLVGMSSQFGPSVIT